MGEENMLKEISQAKEVLWENPEQLPYKQAEKMLRFHTSDIEDARTRLERFAPLIEKLFPETENAHGYIESPLKKIDKTAEALSFGKGNVFVKCDSHLPIAGSVKARGGIYEVLKHTEELALEAGFLTAESGAEEYVALKEKREYFSQYKVQVGSTGNLGMSIGIMSAAIGYQAVVHMSADAKRWKKELLRSKGVNVIEYEEDYSKAVAEGRKLSDEDPKSYFVDDESSSALYLGYAVAGKRLEKQLLEQGISISENHRLIVYIPCGVGGAPGGITFGLKDVFGDNVSVYFVEPVQSPCMLVGMASGKGNAISVQDVGLTGKTEADGLAVGRCSALVAGEMKHLLSGIATVKDEKLYDYMKLLYRNDGILIEPSACAAFQGLLAREKQEGKNETETVTHILWATGGSLMPEEVSREYLAR